MKTKNSALLFLRILDDPSQNAAQDGDWRKPDCQVADQPAFRGSAPREADRRRCGGNGLAG